MVLSSWLAIQLGCILMVTGGDFTALTRRTDGFRWNRDSTYIDHSNECEDT